MNTIPWPLFLQPGKLRELSVDFTEKTGCVLLLRNVEIPYVDYTPTTYRQAFVGAVIGLYSVYYDYSGKFFSFFLYKSDLWEKHRETVCSVLRGSLAHGRLTVDEDKQFLSVLADRYATAASIQDASSLDDLIKRISDPNDAVWQQALETLVKEADQLFGELQDLANGHRWRRAKRDFGYRESFTRDGKFVATFDQKVCASLVNDLKKKRQNKAPFEKDFAEKRQQHWQPLLKEWYMKDAVWNCKGEELMSKLKGIIENDEAFTQKYGINTAPPKSSVSSADKFFSLKKG